MDGARKRPAGTAAAWLWAAAAIVCWGVMFPVGDLLMKEGAMPAASVGTARFLLASPILFAAGFARLGRAMVPHGFRDWATLALLGLVGSAAMAQLLFLAQERVPAVNASLMEAWVPMQVLVLAMLGGAKTTWRHVAGIAVGFAGSLLVLRARGDGRSRGVSGGCRSRRGRCSSAACGCSRGNLRPAAGSPSRARAWNGAASFSSRCFRRASRSSAGTRRRRAYRSRI